MASALKVACVGRLHPEEGVELRPGAMETLAKVSGGDLRKAITTLQSAVRLKVRGWGNTLAELRMATAAGATHRLQC